MAEGQGNDIMTLREVAEYLRVHRSTLYRMMRRRQLPAFRVNSYWRFSRREINRWVAEHSHEPER